MPAVVDGGVRDALTGPVLLRDAVLGLHVELVVPDEDVVGLLRAAPWLRRREKRSHTKCQDKTRVCARRQACACVPRSHLWPLNEKFEAGRRALHGAVHPAAAKVPPPVRGVAVESVALPEREPRYLAENADGQPILRLNEL